jgi:hypothetical protein
MSCRQSVSSYPVTPTPWLKVRHTGSPPSRRNWPGGSGSGSWSLTSNSSQSRRRSGLSASSAFTDLVSAHAAMTVVGRMVPWRRWLALRCGGGFRLCPQRTRDHRRGCTARAPGMAARPQRSVLDQRATGPGFLTTTTPPEVEGPRGPASRAAEGLLRLHVLRTYVVSGGAARLGYRRVGAGPDVHPSIRICRRSRGCAEGAPW